MKCNLLRQKILSICLKSYPFAGKVIHSPENVSIRHFCLSLLSCSVRILICARMRNLHKLFFRMELIWYFFRSSSVFFFQLFYIIKYYSFSMPFLFSWVFKCKYLYILMLLLHLCFICSQKQPNSVFMIFIFNFHIAISSGRSGHTHTRHTW